MNHLTNQEVEAARELRDVRERAFRRPFGDTERLILSRVAFRGELLRTVFPGSGIEDQVPGAMRLMKIHGVKSVLFDKEAYDELDAEEYIG